MRTILAIILTTATAFAAKPPTLSPQYVANSSGWATNLSVFGCVTGVVTMVNIGDRNEIDPFTVDPAAVGGSLNYIMGGGSDYSAIIGGSWNTVNPDTQSAFIGGGDANTVGSGIGSAVVGGLRNTTLGDSYNFMGGGSYSTISVNVGWASILVGDSCSIDGVPGSDYHLILGGYNNKTTAPARFFATILGGQNNTVSAPEAWAIGSNLKNTTPHSVQIGLSDTAKVTVTPSAVTITGMPLVMQDATGGTFTRIWTQDGVLHSEKYTP